VKSPPLLSIGRFARTCRLSIKALRIYDEQGLLPPARIDASGYRYYAREQARDAIAIGLLRSLDVPLPSIKAILGARDPSGLAAQLAGERARLERDLSRARQALSCVERIMRDGELMPYDVSVRDEPALALLVVEETTQPERHVELGHELFGRLAAALAAARLPMRLPVLCLLPEPPDADTLILQMGSPVPEERAQLRLPASRFAFATHRGPFEEVALAQHAVMAWIQERGLEPIGAMREIYLDDPQRVPAAELRTEIGVSIAG
jgi:DNA-binding transcriptional MerR regulator